MTDVIIIPNYTRTRKWGWGWSCAPTGRDAYEIETPTGPDYIGTLNQVCEEISSDPTWASMRSGGTFTNSAWFYDSRRVLSTWMYGLIDDVYDDDGSLDYENSQYGYAWFSGLHLEPELWENGELKIKVE